MAEPAAGCLLRHSLHRRSGGEGPGRRRGSHQGRKADCLVTGVDADGFKHVLGIWLGAAEGSRFWAGVLAELRNRGIRDVLFVCCDGLNGLPDAIVATWPRATVQTCVIHLIRSPVKYVSWKERKKAAAAMRPIYTALNEQGCGQSPFCCSRGCCEAEDGEEQVVVVFGFADGGGDVVVAGLADETHEQVTERGEDAGPGAGADLGRVLAESDITDQVDLVLDAPVTADIGSDVLGAGLAGGEAGDQVHGLGAGFSDALAGFPVALPPGDGAGADDLGDLPDVREPFPDLLGGVHDQVRAGLGAAVAAVLRPVLAGAGPAQLLQGVVQARLVALKEGDRLRRFRALLPCEVVVTA